MKRIRNILLLSVFIVPLVHALYDVHLWAELRETVCHGYAYEVGDVANRNNKLTSVSIIVGDLFYPKKHNKDINHDVIALSCTFNPLSIHTNTLHWKSNLLIRSAMQSIPEQDPGLADSFMQQVVVSMHENKEYIRMFTDLSVKEITLRKEELWREKSKVYIWEVPADSVYYAQSRIDKIGILPLFDAASPSSAARKKLATNLELSVRRLLSQLNADDSKTINSLGIPALAGTTRKVDSDKYLSYKESFNTIYNAIQTSSHTGHIDKIYFVVWDQLFAIDQREAHDALFGAFCVAERFRYDKWKSLRNNILWPVALIIPLLATYINLISNSKNYSRRNLALSVFGCLGVVVAICMVIDELFFHIEALCTLDHLTFSFITELTMATFGLMVILWLNKFWKKKR